MKDLKQEIKNIIFGFKEQFTFHELICKCSEKGVDDLQLINSVIELIREDKKIEDTIINGEKAFITFFAKKIQGM